MFLAAVRLAANAAGQCELAKFEGDGGQEAEGLGYAVAGNDAFLLVGSPADDAPGSTAVGSVYVFEWQRAWRFLGKLSIAGPHPGGFGAAIGLDGDRALIGAPIDDGRAAWSGAAYVLEHLDGQWVRNAKLFADDGFYGQRFGQCVTLRGDRALIGAPNGNSAYLYERDTAGSWAQLKKFSGTGGDSVALGEGLVVIGNPGAFEKGNWSGVVWVYSEQPSGDWVGTKLTASDEKAMWSFGSAVALRDDTLFVGATGARVPNAVYLFHRGELGAWHEVGILESGDGGWDGSFGSTLSVQGSLLVVGDPQDYEDGTKKGAAHVFVEREPARWSRVAKLIPSDGGWEDRFGAAVALHSGVAVVGAPYQDGFGYADGAAYAYAVSPDADGDGVMDACECPGDLDGDRDVDLADLAALLSCLGRGENCADVDEDGRTDGADLAALLAHWGALCPK